MTPAEFEGLKFRLANAVDDHADKLGLVGERRRGGTHQVFADGRRATIGAGLTAKHWRDVDASDEPAIMATARAMLDEIHAAHGPGRVCYLGRLGEGIVHLVNDDGMYEFFDDETDRRLVRLRTLSAHEATAK